MTMKHTHTHPISVTPHITSRSLLTASRSLTHTQHYEVTLPLVMLKCQETFMNYYANKHNGRRLQVCVCVSMCMYVSVIVCVRVYMSPIHSTYVHIPTSLTHSIYIIYIYIYIYHTHMYNHIISHTHTHILSRSLLILHLGHP